ncbi:hypothetical protein THAOC_24154, partial [Thalassiosira oceanica]
GQVHDRVGPPPYLRPQPEPPLGRPRPPRDEEALPHVTAAGPPRAAGGPGRTRRVRRVRPGQLDRRLGGRPRRRRVGRVAQVGAQEPRPPRLPGAVGRQGVRAGEEPPPRPRRLDAVRRTQVVEEVRHLPPGGMTWEQVWSKYEEQVLSESAGVWTDRLPPAGRTGAGNARRPTTRSRRGCACGSSSGAS